MIELIKLIYSIKIRNFCNWKKKNKKQWNWIIEKYLIIKKTTKKFLKKLWKWKKFIDVSQKILKFEEIKLEKIKIENIWKY